MFFSAGNKTCRQQHAPTRRRRGWRRGDALNKVWDFNVAAGRSDQEGQALVLRLRPRLGRLPVHRQQLLPIRRPGRPADDRRRPHPSGVARLTTALGDKNKVAGYLDRIRKFRGHENSAPAGYAIAGEATDIRAPKQYYTSEIKYTGTLTQQVPRRSRLRDQQRELLADAAGSEHVPQLEASGGTPTNSLVIPKRDTILQTAYDQYDGGIYYREPIRKTFVTSASYVTGSHNIKVGMAVWLRLLLAAAPRGGRPDPALSHQRAGAGDHPQHAAGIRSRHERRPGHLRAGPVDARPLHHQPGRSLRALQQLDRRALGVGGGPLRAGAALRSACRTCRTGTTSRRASASRGTCRATARPR